jgi:hypothetical protein
MKQKILDIMTNLRFYFVVVSLITLILTTKYFNLKDNYLKQEEENFKQRAIIDSLHDENFIKFTEIGRYEITLEHLKETNPKVGKYFEDWMSHNTE